MTGPSLRFNYVVVLYIIFNLQKNSTNEKDFVPKYAIRDKIAAIPDEKRELLNFNWREEGFNRVIYRLQEMNYIESKVITQNKKLRKLIKLSDKGKKMVDFSYDVVKRFMD